MAAHIWFGFIIFTDFVGQSEKKCNNNDNQSFISTLSTAIKIRVCANQITKMKLMLIKKTTNRIN